MTLELYNRIFVKQFTTFDRLCGLVVKELLAADAEVPSSIAGATRFSEYQWVWNGVHIALLRVNEELLERKVAAPV
jgi:hypothetical protein